MNMWIEEKEKDKIKGLEMNKRKIYGLFSVFSSCLVIHRYLIIPYPIILKTRSIKRMIRAILMRINGINK